MCRAARCRRRPPRGNAGDLCRRRQAAPLTPGRDPAASSPPALPPTHPTRCVCGQSSRPNTTSHNGPAGAAACGDCNGVCADACGRLSCGMKRLICAPCVGIATCNNHITSPQPTVINHTVPSSCYVIIHNVYGTLGDASTHVTCVGTWSLW